MSADTQATHLPPFPPDYRACGVLLHVTSLASPYGIGDLGPSALPWIDRLCKAGQTWWQALPVGPTRIDTPSRVFCCGTALRVSESRKV